MAEQARQTWTRALVARAPDELHRVSTPLELLFDLCFVVAVAQAASSLEHAIADDRLAEALVGYPMVFFAIWWAWMNFTWFASAYDNDDLLYRLATVVQITGALILAAGVPRAFDEREFGIITLGYAVMRLALVAEWLRAARDDPPRRVTDRRYALGVAACTIGWVLLFLLPGDEPFAGFAILVLAELAVPVWAERAAPTTWHPHHIVERYGLFTILVLGESILAASLAIQSALDAGEHIGEVVQIASGGLLIVFSMWWIYFAQPVSHLVERAREDFGVFSSRESFVWGYGHYFVFGSAAAVGAGLVVAVHEATEPEVALSRRGAVLAVAIPLALYLLSVWVLHVRTKGGSRSQVLATPITAALVVLAALAGLPVVAVGLLPALLIAYSISRRSPRPGQRAR